MNIKHRSPPQLFEFEKLNLLMRPTSGTEDDDDDRNDGHAGENEAVIRVVDENMESREEFEIDDEDEFGHSDIDEHADENHEYYDDLPD